MGGKPGEPRPMRGTDRELWALTRAVPVGTDEGQLQKKLSIVRDSIFLLIHNQSRQPIVLICDVSLELSCP